MIKRRLLPKQEDDDSCFDQLKKEISKQRYMMQDVVVVSTVWLTFDWELLGVGAMVLLQIKLEQSRKRSMVFLLLLLDFLDSYLLRT